MSEPDPVEDFHRRRDAIRAEMGGAARIARLHDAGRRTVRDRIEAFLDPGTFAELGTFTRSENPADRDGTPGDGKIGGHGLVDARPVTVAGDDVTVRRGSSSPVGHRRLHRLWDQAMTAGNPFVYFGETGGGRIPDLLSSEGYTKINALPFLATRGREIPFATTIVGHSFGGSSFVAALSDFVVQVRGSCLAVTSPHVVKVAIGEDVTMEDLGGVDVHSRRTGQIDLAVDTEDEAYTAIRTFLSFLPANRHEPPPRREPRHPAPDPELAALVPTARRRGYDMRRVVRRIVDDGEFLELRPLIGRGLLTGLARLDGHPVGVLASQPLQLAGALDPDACDKAVRLITLCDAFGLPLVFLQDTPGFLVGPAVEHARLLHKATLFQQALTLATVPIFSVVVRKGYGLAYFLLGGTDMGADLLCAWPGAEIGFMDPDVGANVVGATQLAGLDPDERRERLTRLAADLVADNDPYGAAGILSIDEVIDPADTTVVLADALRRHAPAIPRRAPSPLASWPTCW